MTALSTIALWVLKQSQNMKLQAKNREQLQHIADLIGSNFEEWNIGAFPIYSLQMEEPIAFDAMAQIVDYLRQPEDKKKDMFELCWVAYNRKGSKKKSLEQWVKLKDSEKDVVLQHIKAYVSSRERQYQKDFERYLRDRTFNDVVLKGNEVYFDPVIARETVNSKEESGSVVVNGQTYR